MERDLRYPIGPFTKKEKPDETSRGISINEIKALPRQLREAVNGLTDSQLDTPYRPGGWTLRQVIHHIPDSHMNGYIRCKLALTEHEPVIKTYDQDRWVELGDCARTPVEVSVVLTEALHHRWASLLESLDESAFGRCFHHAEKGQMNVDHAVALYAWHGRHHVGHILALRERMNW